jgi:hypothetical protein
LSLHTSTHADGFNGAVLCLPLDQLR